VKDTTIPVRLSIEPSYHTTLRSLDTLTAVVVRPDGSAVPVPVDSDYERGGGGTYTAEINNMPLSGVYEVRVAMQTGPMTFNDPGESIYSSAPPNTVPVPLMTRPASEFFVVPTNSVSPIATKLTAAISGGQLLLSWPADHLGWSLQVLTNGLSAWGTNNWVTVPGSETKTQMVVPLWPPTRVFYRMMYRITQP
jgi:hypothetical protein